MSSPSVASSLIDGNSYYEGKELETDLRTKKPGELSDELTEALSIPPLAPPPWLIAMQRFGPPPSYPNLRIKGLNAPIPSGYVILKFRCISSNIAIALSGVSIPGAGESRLWTISTGRCMETFSECCRVLRSRLVNIRIDLNSTDISQHQNEIDRDLWGEIAPMEEGAFLTPPSIYIPLTVPCRRGGRGRRVRSRSRNRCPLTIRKVRRRTWSRSRNTVRSRYTIRIQLGRLDSAWRSGNT